MDIQIALKEFIDKIDLHDWDDFYNLPPIRGNTTGFHNLDEFWRVEKGQLNIITGVPGHGKSEFMDQLAVNFVEKLNWKILFYSPENYPLNIHYSKLVEKKIEKPFYGNPRMTLEESKRGYIWVRNNFDFIDPHKNENLTIKELFAIVLEKHKEEKIDCFVLDPWNEIEITKNRDESETDFIGKSLKGMRIFARKNNIALFVIAHPRKLDVRKNGSPSVPHPYDISGSSHWFNKADNCFCVFRNRATEEVDFHIQKIKFKQFGKPGVCSFKWMAGKGGIYEPSTDVREKPVAGHDDW